MQGRPEPRFDLRWDDVRLFLALCRARTVGAAAGVLGVDASTVSRRLATLEEELSATLFDRGRDGITPTEAAEGLMPVAEEIEQGMVRFANAAQGFEREASGLVRMACAPGVAVALVMPLVAELLAKHPALRVELEDTNTLLDLTRREADLALRVVRPTRGDLVVTRLLETRWVLAASPAHAAKLGRLRRWTDAPWAAWTDQFAHAPPARWLAAHAPEVEPVVRSDSLAIQLAAVTSGIAVMLVPDQSLEPHGLVEVRVASSLSPAAEQWPTNELYLVTHRALRDVPRVKVVWDLVLERLGKR